MYLSLISVLISASSAWPTANTAPNCYIQIKSEMRTGEISERTSKFRLRNKAACVRMQKLLGSNFGGRPIKKVSTRAEWKP